MRRPELDAILAGMIESHQGISDLVFAVGRPLQVEVQGVLRPVRTQPYIHALSAYQIEKIALNLIGEDRRLIGELLRTGSCDCGYGLSEQVRFRVNIFRQRGNWAIVMRRLQTEMPTMTSLNLPNIFEDLVNQKNGLILVTGSTGSGKTTTLAAVLNEINLTQAVHVVTLEDPIEFIHQHKKATFNQRELGSDFDSYPSGLRAALRQAPKVILVGEMRDRETVEIALNAAETGHLVLSTIHTIDAGQSINRIIGMFPRDAEKQLRPRLAETLRYVVSQRLAPREGGGRTLLLEIMGSNLRTRETVALGEGENRDFYDIITDSASFGWTTFDLSICRAYEAGLITEETALLYATRKGIVQRNIDQYKKERGLGIEMSTGLRLDTPGAGDGGGPPALPTKRGFLGF
jgi:twitching motility protein PilT